MLEDVTARLLPLLKGTLPTLVLPLLARAPGRPRIPDDADAALRNPKRRAILRLVQAEPGLNMKEARLRLDMPPGSFQLHVNKLLTVGLLTKRVAGNLTQLYPAESAPPADAPVLTSEIAKAVASLILEKPGLSSREIADTLDAKRRTVQLHLANLIAERYIQQDKSGAPPTYHATVKLGEELSRK